MTALQSGYIAARRVFEDPGATYRTESRDQQRAAYDLLWSYYNNAMFDNTATALNATRAFSWQQYKANYNLYRNIRLIYNPVRRLVDFYPGVVYPGALSEDGAALPDGVALAIPFSEDTSPALRTAIAQIWQWSNWQLKKAVQVRYGAALGNVLTEVTDDVARGKVCLEVAWPGHVCDLSLDAAGNVKAYALEYQAHDEDGAYQYRKEVDATSFRYFRNDQPYDYGYGTLVANPYGFVPATWTKHIDCGSDYGSPAVAGSLGKIDELNNLASHVHDQIHKVIGSPLIMWSNGSISNLFGTKKRGSTSEFEEPSSDQESMLMLKGPQGGHVESLAGNLELAESALFMDKLIAEIEQDHPELTFYRELRGMSQVTGPAASRLVGDVASRVIEAQASYDAQNMKLFQMAVAIAGYRVSSGSWGPSLSRQQKKFQGFGLDSYERGDLDMAIMPRPLLTPTRLEQAQESQAMWTGVATAVNAGVPLEIMLRREAGWTDEEIDELGRAKEESIRRAQMLAQEDLIDDEEDQETENGRATEEAANGATD